MGEQSESGLTPGEESRFVEQVFAVVRRIPRGKVTTYGRIARAVGAPRSARMVGWALHNSPPDISDVAHRVVNRNGELTGGWSWGHPAVMRALLEEEGVTFVEEFQVDLARHLWEPDRPVQLPLQPPPTK
ncbi:MAG TPA: MGMT family protein [Thermomicrobiaceae bacterium]|nr:MGMT family protein [Thermomicrobiaceae bacterium]